MCVLFRGYVVRTDLCVDANADDADDEVDTGMLMTNGEISNGDWRMTNSGD